MPFESAKLLANFILIGGAVSLVAGGALLWDSQAPKAIPIPAEAIVGDTLPVEELHSTDWANCLACHWKVAGLPPPEGATPAPEDDVSGSKSEELEPNEVLSSAYPKAHVSSNTASAGSITSSVRITASDRAAPPIVGTSAGETRAPLSATRKAAPPVRLRIPSVQIDGKVLAVRASALEGGTDWPIPLEDISWYVGTPLPGDKGNAVLAGHVATKSGGGVFRNLNRVRKGTLVYVDTTRGTLTFIVDSIRIVAPSSTSVLANTSEPTLTLITCAGEYDAATSTFSHRLVIGAKLEASSDQHDD